VAFNRALIEAPVEDILVHRYNLLYGLVTVPLLFARIVNDQPLFLSQYACHPKALSLAVGLFCLLSLAGLHTPARPFNRDTAFRVLRHVAPALSSLECLLEHATRDTRCPGKQTSLHGHLCLALIAPNCRRPSEEWLRLEDRVDGRHGHEVVLLDELLGVHKSQSRVVVSFERRSVGVRLARTLSGVVIAVVLSEER